MATKLSEDTEIRVSLKTIISVLVSVIAITSVVVRYETKIDSLSDDIDKLKTHIQSSAKVMQENSKLIRDMEIEQIKHQKDIEYIQDNL